MLLDAALDALTIIADPVRLMFVAFGTLLGLLVGVIPGIGGLVGLALLLPFTFAMDPYTALAFLVGVSAVTTTSDTIPAVLFGVPGTTGSAATVLDGHPMAKRGEASRAYGAAFTASVVGGLFGALVLAVSIPILRPFVLFVGSPELLAITILGLTLVAALSQGAMLKGVVAAGIGLVLSNVVDEAQTGTLRWTFDSIYLWDGLSLVPLALGLFAVPELIDLGVARTSVARSDAKANRLQQLQGMRDAARNWWLVLRCSSIGTLLGAIPGVGANVIDWIAYGFAAKTVKGAAQTFGKGDVRGVIASESSNNAKEGGALVPTLAFGIPGSASMAILLGAFLIHGISPGPEMLGQRLDVTFTLVWTIAIANLLGAGTCFLFAGQFARIATVRAGLIVPLVLGLMVIGAFQGAQHYGDLIVLFVFGVLGWVMKQLDWPRPPLVLGFVLGGLIESYLFISQIRYGFEWMLRPVPLVVWTIILIMVLRPLLRRLWPRAARGPAVPEPRPVPLYQRRADILVWIGAAALLIYVLWSASLWRFPAGLMPQTVAVLGLAAITANMATSLAAPATPRPAVRPEPPDPAIVRRTVSHGLWFVGLISAVYLIGMLPAIGLFMLAYMILEGRTHPVRALAVTLPFWLGAYLLFHEIMHVPWPRSLLGDAFPAVRVLAGRGLL
jgi:TctA family transporter